MHELVDTPAPAWQDRRHARLTLAPDTGWGQRFRLMAKDLGEGARLWRLCWMLAMADIKLRYRGSALGPFWLTLSTAIMIGSMGFIYAYLFHTDIHQYLPYLTVSIIIWNYLNVMISEGCTCFIIEEKTIRGTQMPFSVHTARSVLRNTIVLAHNLVVVVPVFLLLHVPLTWHALWAVPALLLWMVDAFALSLLLGALCARFRDVGPIVLSLLQMVFFATPIMWYANILLDKPRLNLIVRLNPFFYLLEIVRAPILNTPMTPQNVQGAIIVSGAILLVSAIGFARIRSRIAYWV